MTWTRLSDDFTDRPEMLRVSRSARLLHIEAMIWCNRMGQDGKLPTAAIRRITDGDDPSADIADLLTAGIWAPVDGDPDAYQLDWSDQEPAAEVKARASYRAATQKRYRERKAKHDRGDHGLCDPRYCKAAVTGNATSNKHGHETPSRPVPSRPLGRDREQDAGQPGADAPTGRQTPTAETCPHGIPGGLTYQHDGHVACDLCALITPRYGTIRDWMDQSETEGLGPAALAVLLDGATDAEDDITWNVAPAVYGAHGGPVDNVGDPTDEKLARHIDAFIIQALRANPQAMPQQTTGRPQ